MHANDPGLRANDQLVDRLIALGALWSPELIAAFRATPRHGFVDRVFQYNRKRDTWQEVIVRDPSPEELRLVYADRALITRVSPGGRGEPALPISSSSQPSLMAQMLEDLRPAAGQRVLEVGAGTGYNAALLAHVTGPGQVVSVDVDRHVLSEAWDHLRAFRDLRVQLHHADGRLGFPAAAPYDRIMVTAATPDLEAAWLEQLAPDGRLLAPLALAPGLAFVVCGTVSAGVFEGRLTRAAYFMPLRAEHESGDAEPGSFPGSADLRSLPAPWAGWFDRRRLRLGWTGLVQSLAFYGWLRGLRVAYDTLPEGEPSFGVRAPAGTGVCWLGPQVWRVDGEGGRDLGWSLWRSFLDAGGPWPTEFRVRASATQGVQRTGDAESYSRQGPNCAQVWELREPRERPAWL